VPGRIGVDYVSALAIDPHTPATLYAGACGTAVKSTDGGDTWIAANTGLPTSVASVIAIDPITSGTLYAGTGSGVFKSTDAGSSWTPFNTGLATTNVGTLAIDPTAPGTLYAGTHEGAVCKSTDSAGSWHATGLEGGPICGDGVQCSGEGCDDGNLVDGDGCAANCTLESDVAFNLVPGVVDLPGIATRTSGTVIHGDFLSIPLPFSGSQVLTIGTERDGHIPVVIKAAAVHLARVPVGANLGCACPRAVAAKTCGGTVLEADGMTPSPDTARMGSSARTMTRKASAAIRRRYA